MREEQRRFTGGQTPQPPTPETDRSSTQLSSSQRAARDFLDFLSQSQSLLLPILGPTATVAILRAALHTAGERCRSLDSVQVDARRVRGDRLLEQAAALPIDEFRDGAFTCLQELEALTQEMAEEHTARDLARLGDWLRGALERGP